MPPASGYYPGSPPPGQAAPSYAQPGYAPSGGEETFGTPPSMVPVHVPGTDPHSLGLAVGRMSPEAQQFLGKYTELLEFLLPRYVYEGKSYLNIGVGCTGGKHRSVAIAEALKNRIDGKQYLVSVKHRDISKS